MKVISALWSGLRTALSSVPAPLRWLKWPVAVLLYFFFSFTAMLAGLQGLIMLPFRPRMTSNILRAMDALAAAQIGYSGRETISKECGREILKGNPCVFCIRICKGLSYFDYMHCEREGSKPE